MALLVTSVSGSAAAASADSVYPKPGVYYGQKASKVLTSYLTLIVKPDHLMDMRVDYKMGMLENRLLVANDVPFTINGENIVLDPARFAVVVQETNAGLGMALTALGYTTSTDKVETTHNAEDESVRLKVFPASGGNYILNIKAVLYEDKPAAEVDVKTTSSIQIGKALTDE